MVILKEAVTLRGLFALANYLDLVQFLCFKWSTYVQSEGCVQGQLHSERSVLTDFRSENVLHDKWQATVNTLIGCIRGGIDM